MCVSRRLERMIFRKTCLISSRICWRVVTLSIRQRSKFLVQRCACRSIVSAHFFESRADPSRRGQVVVRCRSGDQAP
jgi:hypothetical protein